MILLVDKPAGMTSQRLVSQIKRAAGGKLKIGHTGTLDPMCTGLLPVLTGKDTKLTQFFPHTKAYLASIRFGIKTDTADVTGEIIERSSLPTESEFRAVLPSLVGKCEQVPPMYSAVHVDGKRLYELARQGVEVERQARPVEIFDLSFVDSVGDGEFRFSVTCSAGTYIRTLCEDLADRLGLCAAMSALRRTESNGFSLDGAYALSEVLSAAEEGRLSDLSLTCEEAFAHLPTVVVPSNGERFYCNGGVLTANRLSGLGDDGLYRAYGESSAFLGLLSLSEGIAKAAFLNDEP